jgi:DNA-binding transcriptional LysR family regulator
MMRNQIDLKRMRYVVEVARAGSVTLAAETLGLTQPALTRSITEVEDELKTKLFHRIPRGVRLTEAGKRFVERAKQIVGDVDDLVTELREGPSVAGGRLRLGVAPAGDIHHVIRPLRNLARARRDLRIEIVDGTAQALCPRLLSGDLNAVIGASTYFSRWRELEVTMLRRLHFGCIVRKDHPITRVAAPTELDILQYPIILPASVEAVYSDIAMRYHVHGIPLRPQYIIENTYVVEALVHATDAFYPVHVPDPNFRTLTDDFVVLKDVVKMPDRFLCLARSTMHPKTEAVALLEQQLLCDLKPVSECQITVQSK